MKLFKHVSALSELFKEDGPDLSLIRGVVIVDFVYIFGDASGLGFWSLWGEGVYVGYRF